MNIQEFAFIVREALPIKIVLLNNRSLGMIHQFQDQYFAGNHAQTDGAHGYYVPSFIDIARAYGIPSASQKEQKKLKLLLEGDGPALIEISLPESTYAYPKLGMNRPIHEQEPLLPEGLKAEIERIL